MLYYKNIYFIISAIFFCLLTSCFSGSNIVKRKYEPGYYTDFSISSKKNKSLNYHTDNQNWISGDSKPDSTITNAINETILIKENLLAYNEQNIVKLTKTHNRPGNVSNLQHVLGIKSTTIGNQNYYQNSLKDSTLFNQKKTIINSGIGAKETEPLGVVSFILAIVTALFFLIFLGLEIESGYLAISIVALIACILGCISVNRIRYNKEKYKGWFWSLMAVLLGTFISFLALGKGVRSHLNFDFGI